MLFQYCIYFCMVGLKTFIEPEVISLTIYYVKEFNVLDWIAMICFLQNIWPEIKIYLYKYITYLYFLYLFLGILVSMAYLYKEHWQPQSQKQNLCLFHTSMSYIRVRRRLMNMSLSTKRMQMDSQTDVFLLNHIFLILTVKSSLCPTVLCYICLHQNIKLSFFSCTGEWHQYDDIICVEPSKGLLKKLKETFWPEQRQNLIQGREIAGAFMLETIFDLLRSWSEINLKNFFIQLKQFHQIYANPYVIDNAKISKWLDYTEKEVSGTDELILSGLAWRSPLMCIW